MPIYNFACECGEVAEARVGFGIKTMPCSCGQSAKRSSVYQVAIGTTEKQYRVSDVVEASQELDYAHTRQEQQEGRKLKWRSPYKAAMRKVRHSTR